MADVGGIEMASPLESMRLLDSNALVLGFMRNVKEGMLFVEDD